MGNFKFFTKKCEKKYENICRIKICPYLCTRNQEITPVAMVLKRF